jgi:hypothetical protein
MRIVNYEKMSCLEMVNGVRMGGLVFLRDVFRRCPLVVFAYRIELYEYAKSCKLVDMMRFLERKFPELKPNPLEIKME